MRLVHAILSAVFCCLASTVGDAFVVPLSSTQHPTAAISTGMHMVKNQQREESSRNAHVAGLERVFGVAAAVLTFNAAFALADIPMEVHETFIGFRASTIQVSSEIKTLDMSLPSYNSIADPKASVETVPELTVPEEKVAVVSPKRKKAAATKALPGPPVKMSTFLPSLDKKPPKQETSQPVNKDKKEDLKAEESLPPPAQALAPKAEKSEAVEVKEATPEPVKAIEQPKEEKERRKAKKTAVETVKEQEKDEKKQPKVDIVDMSMPTYDDSSVSGQKGSIFSL